MAIATHVKTYTLTDLQVAAVTGDTPGSLVDLPGIQSCEVTLGNDSTVLRGDNADLAVIDQGNSGTFTLEAGGIDLAVMPTILGGTTTNAGVTPNATRTYDLKADDRRPYFLIVGVTPDDGKGEDVHVVVWKAKATGDFSLTLQDREFLVPSIEGTFIGRTSDKKMLSLVHHETGVAAAIPT